MGSLLKNALKDVFTKEEIEKLYSSFDINPVKIQKLYLI